MQRRVGEPKHKKNWISIVGIVISTAAIAFALGLYTDDTALGKRISSTVSNFFVDSSQSGLPEDLDYSSVEEVYDVLRREFDGKLNEKELLDGIKSGLARATGDPYTVYLNSEAAEAFNESLNGEFSGIGAEIAVKNDQLQIVAPLEDTPADKAGLLPGDPIIAIDGEDTAGITVEEAVTKIRGEKGTEVVLTIVRDNQTKDIKIVRDNIDVPNAESEILDGNIGYIDLSTFGEDAIQETKLIAQDLKNKGVKAIILDVRGNSGGYLQAAVEIAGLWLDNDVVVEQKGQESGTLSSGPRGTLYGIPTVVLINEGSASASEIVAGALQDHGVATILGEQSFGKGSVQSLEELGEGAQLKVTIARWYTPAGTNIDEEGITPDVKVELTVEDFNNDRDPQLDKALELLRK